jgi:hypothetical protein
MPKIIAGGTAITGAEIYLGISAKYRQYLRTSFRFATATVSAVILKAIQEQAWINLPQAPLRRT